MAPPPTFNGIDPLTQKAPTFVQKATQYLNVNVEDQGRWPTIFISLLEGPARDAYNLALGTAALPAFDPPDDPAARQQAGHDRYVVLSTWLIDRFFGAAEQEAIRQALFAMAQDRNESPRQFFGRVSTAVQEANYAQPLRADMTADIWIRGIPQYLSDWIRSL